MTMNDRLSTARPHPITPFRAREGETKVRRVTSVPASGRGSCAALILALFLIAAPARAAKFHVENWGVDSGSCGAAATPCRSIGKAVSLAVSGDSVLVGPGRYSNDLNHNDTFNEPGEEPSIGITIAPGVTVTSTHGAAATRLDYIENGVPSIVISEGPSAVFGKKNHGFTIYLAPSSSVPGLIAVNASAGSSSTSGNVILFNAPVSHGFGILGGTFGTASDNRIGAVGTGSLDDGIVGLSLVKNNVVNNALFGFDGNATYRHNVAVENTFGFNLGDPSGSAVTEFTNNIVVANSFEGVSLNPGSSVTGAFKNNTIDNNDPVNNCGLDNGSGGLLSAAKNFWGAGTGPGANPADAICNDNGSTTGFIPFLTHPAPASGPGAIQ